MPSCRRILMLSALTLAFAACGSSTPQVKVIGVSQPKAHAHMVVFVEVANPTGRKLNLSRLDYQLAAEEWFSSEGELAVKRPVAAKATTVIEIPVPFSAPKQGEKVAYTLKGTLYAEDHELQRSWSLHVNGFLDSRAIAKRAAHIRVRVADTVE